MPLFKHDSVDSSAPGAKVDLAMPFTNNNGHLNEVAR